MNNVRRYALVLSLYLNTRGLSFVLFEGSFSPYDWGIFEIRGQTKENKIIDKVNRLFNQYVPDVLVMQEMGPNGTRRASRLEMLNQTIGRIVGQRGIQVFADSR